MSIATALTGTGASGYVPGTPRTASILVVDDNASKRLALKSMLAPLGYEVVEADSGSACLRRVMATVFAVILLDVRMPIMSGFETAALIRLKAESELTPIIYVTAQAADEVTSDRFTSGAVDFITAPIDPDELRAKVSALATLFLEGRLNAARARDLQVTADQLRRLTEDAPIGIFQTDTDHRYTYTNTRWSQITGVSREEAVGSEWTVMLGAAQLEAVSAEFEEHVAGEDFSSRMRMVSRDGTPRIVVITARALLRNGRPAGWVGTLADITSEAEAAEALVEARDQATEASRLKSDFLANMSHEIRTPMSSVIGWAELLLETDLDASQQGFVRTMSRSGEALMNVIDGILDFSRIEQGRLEVEDAEFDVSTVVDEVVDLLAQSATIKGLSLVSAMDDSVPDLAHGDANRLRQVLTNLIGNAIKFTQTGGITVSVSADEADGSAGADGLIRFEVSDTGMGIAADQFATLFEPFTQGDTSTTRVHGGTGLGLAISSGLTALMGGEMGVTSAPGAGSIFWFTIRAAPPGVRSG